MTSFHSNYCITLYITRKIYCTFFAVILVNISTFFFFFTTFWGKHKPFRLGSNWRAYFRRLIKPTRVFLFSKFGGWFSIFTLTSCLSARQRGKEASRREQR